MIPATARAMVFALLAGLSLAGCSLFTPVDRAPPGAGADGTPAVATALPPALGRRETAAPSDTAPPPTTPISPTLPVSATIAASATPTATLASELPLPGRRVPATAWRTLVKAPGLPDMSVAPDLGPDTHFAVATGNAGLNTLRAELQQPANAWVTGVTSDTLLIGVFLGRRRGDGHDLEVVDLAVDGSVVNVATRLTAPGEWQGGDDVFPVHLIAVDRSSLPSGPLAFHFLDADTLGSAGRAAAFDAAVQDVDPAVDGLAHTAVLIIQTANEPPPGAPASPLAPPSPPVAAPTP